MNPTHIAIAGSGRSGTTWILDALADANRMRTVFEPLHPQAIPAIGRYANTYLSRGSEAPELKSYLEGMFNSRTRNIWTDYRVRPDRLVPRPSNMGSVSEFKLLLGRYRNLIRNVRLYRRDGRSGVITKFIRANLMLGWLEENFDLTLLFVVRHPGAVVASQLEKGTEWDARALEAFKGDRLLWRDFLHVHERFLNGRLSPVELYTTIWCIQNALPIRESVESGRPLTYYEKLITESASEWERVAAALHLDMVPGADAVAAPSQQSSGHVVAGLQNQKLRVSRWQQRFSAGDLTSMQGVLDRFEISVYAARDVMPLS